MENHIEGVPLTVDGEQYKVTVQDFGSHWKLRVYHNGRVLGFRDHPHRVTPDVGVLTFTVRSIVREHVKGTGSKTRANL